MPTICRSIFEAYLACIDQFWCVSTQCTGKIWGVCPRYIGQFWGPPTICVLIFVVSAICRSTLVGVSTIYRLIWDLSTIYRSIWDLSMICRSIWVVYLRSIGQLLGVCLRSTGQFTISRSIVLEVSTICRSISGGSVYDVQVTF